MNKHIVFLLILLPFFSAASVSAEDKPDRDFPRHEVRIGWGDQMFEKIMWHNTGYIVNALPETITLGYEENYRYAQHFFVEYSYTFKRWLSAGLLFDTSSCFWDDVTRNGAGVEIARDKNRFFSNYAIIPNARFTYLRKPHVNMYAGLGMGMAINTGTSRNIYGKKTVFGIAGNMTLLGVSGVYSNWVASAELNAYMAMQDKKHMFLLGSRMITISIGRRF